VRTELTPHACIALTIGLCLCLAPRQRSLGSQLVDETTRPTWRRNLEFAYTAAALAICAVLTLSGSFSPFLYFSF